MAFRRSDTRGDLIMLRAGTSVPAINKTIAGSKPGDTIFFDAGDYVCESTILLKANRRYVGTGRSSRLLQAPATQLDFLIDFDPSEPSPREDVFMRDIFLDGNRANNTTYTAGSGFTANNGLRLFNVLNSSFQRVTARHFGRDGVVLDGSGGDFDHSSATNHFLDCWAYDNGRYGVAFEVNSQDNHWSQSDIGYNDFGSVLFLSGSNSLTDCALWGTKQGPGLMIGAPVNLIRSCQIEGHAQHAFWLTEFGDYTSIIGNKIYDNGDLLGGFDGIYAQGSAAHPVSHTVIEGNVFLSGLYFDPPVPAPYYRHAVTLDTHTFGTSFAGNELWLLDPNGQPTLTRLPIYGLKAGDSVDGVRWRNAADKPTYGQAGERLYIADAGNEQKWSEYRGRWEDVLTHGYSAEGGELAGLTAGATGADVTFSQDRFDTSFTPTLALSWDAQWWVTAISSTGFSVAWSPAAPGGGWARWGLIRH